MAWELCVCVWETINAFFKRRSTIVWRAETCNRISRDWMSINPRESSFGCFKAAGNASVVDLRGAASSWSSGSYLTLCTPCVPVWNKRRNCSRGVHLHKKLSRLDVSELRSQTTSTIHPQHALETFRKTWNRNYFWMAFRGTAFLSQFTAVEPGEISLRPFLNRLAPMSSIVRVGYANFLVQIADSLYCFPISPHFSRDESFIRRN